MYWRKLGLLIIFVAVACEKKLEAGAKDFSLPRPYVLSDKNLKVAVFAGGCFWCMEPPFEKLKGVKAVISGYAGGSEKNPTYEEVSYGRSSHVEAVLVVYDPKVVSYAKLLEIFWQNINPEQADGQFYDRGPQYMTYIFYANETEQKLAEKSKANLAATKKFSRIATRVSPATAFWPAEDYHQDYYKKNPAHYYQYRTGSGRDAYLKSKWR